VRKKRIANETRLRSGLLSRGTGRPMNRKETDARRRKRTRYLE
jgi:hypothetical protein